MSLAVKVVLFPISLQVCKQICLTVLCVHTDVTGHNNLFNSLTLCDLAIN